MQSEQSVMEMNGSPPMAFTPGWGDAVGVGSRHDIPIENLSITRGVIASDAMKGQLNISATVQRVVALTLEIRQQARAVATLSDIPFEVTGELADEVVFNSGGQNVPWDFLLKINSASGQMTLSFTLNYAGLSVVDALAGINFYEALACGGEFRISGRHPLTGGEVFLARGNVPSGAYKTSDSRFVRLLADLVFIQNKTGLLFTIPEQHIRFQDANAIAATAEILKTGHARYESEPWISISKVEQAKYALESFANEQPIPMALHFEGQVVSIFGVYVPLGPVTLFCERSYITKNDLETMRRDLEGAAPGSSLGIKFTPFEKCPVQARYIRWLPKDEANAITQLPMYAGTEPLIDEDGWTLPNMSVDAAVALLKSWYEEDPEEQKSSWERLKVALDEDRLSERKLF